ncbi:hypothetical protein QUA13_29765, partial [Microcoleus sp. S28C3]|uniref:hypothetical protein n=1 Tax=Microcoleus sp. S28C3 TaxID=3055414 RepID=UPI002FD35A7E
NICPNGIIEPYLNLSNSLSYLFFIPSVGANSRSPLLEYTSPQVLVQHTFNGVVTPSAISVNPLPCNTREGLIFFLLNSFLASLTSTDAF